jgi:UDP-glucose 4-epimerase
VSDVVRANVLALRSSGLQVYNVGTGRETDVNALFQRLKKATDSHVAEVHAHAKKGEQLRSVLDVRRIHLSLGWTPLVQLDEGLRLTVEYFRSKAGHGI